MLKVRAICDACLRVPVDLAADVAARVLPRATTQTLAQLRASLKRAVIAVDPEGANQRHQQANKKRRVNLYPDEDGMATLSAYLTAPQAMTAHGWLTALARGLGTDDPRPMDARRADLLTALLTGNLTITPPDTTDTDTPDRESTPPPTPTPASTRHRRDDRPVPTGENTHTRRAAPARLARRRHRRPVRTISATPREPRRRRSRRCRWRFRPSPRPHPPRAARTDTAGAAAGIPQPVHPGKPLVHVLVPITTLYGADHHPAELAGYGPVPAALARDIATDSLWKRLVTDPLSGTLLDHGRSTYRPPTATAEFIRARDIHCRFPTCRRRALDSELDHTQAWTADRGHTSDTNLYDACPHHHHVKHDGPGWTVTQHPDATISWTTPTGHHYSSQPYDYRPEPPAARTAAPTEDQPQPDRHSPFDPDPDPDRGDVPSWATTRIGPPPLDPPPTDPSRPAGPSDRALLQRNLGRITRVAED